MDNAFLNQRYANIRKALKENYRDRYDQLAQALAKMLVHIRIPDEEFAKATESYNRMAGYLARRLEIPESNIKVFPQGSASLKTLVRGLGNDNFDIDAACRVITPLNNKWGNNHGAFFNLFGEALKGFDGDDAPKPKNRCWTLTMPGERFYLELTPGELLRQPAYPDALRIVDNNLNRWTMSNPHGFTDDFNRIASLSLKFGGGGLLKVFAAEHAKVPDQDIALSDLLRITIRLFKRHRDVIFRQRDDKEFAPISVLITTLAARAYEEMAYSQEVFGSYVDAMLGIAQGMHRHIQIDSLGKYVVSNRTLPDGQENFAERWNDDQGERYQAFNKWALQLAQDLEEVVQHTDPEQAARTLAAKLSIPLPSGGGGLLSGLLTSNPGQPVKPAPTTLA